MKISSRLLSLIFSVLAVLSFSGCSSRDLSHEENRDPDYQSQNDFAVEIPEEGPDEKIKKLADKMTLREKLGQIFIIRPDALNFSLSREEIDDSGKEGVTNLDKDLISALNEYPAGGIAIFSKNLLSPAQITELISQFQQNSSIPMFICVDEEGGRVARLANQPGFDLPKYTSASDTGKSRDPEEAFKMGDTIGKYLHSFGFNMDFAPVADVNTNKENPVIGNRAFSDNAEEAALMASNMAEGLRKNSVIPVFKHFPGHGDTKEDSHLGSAVTEKTREELEQCELIPFKEAKSTDCIMACHIAVPKVTGEMTPASISKEMITGILKEDMGFEGLVITDSLSMKAITDFYTPGEAAVAALKAGCDILLMPQDYRQAFDAVEACVEDGEISESLIDEIAFKILKFKYESGILDLDTL